MENGIEKKVEKLSELVQMKNLGVVNERLMQSTKRYLLEGFDRAIAYGKTEEEILEHLDAKLKEYA